MFDPFGDLETEGYLRNFEKEKNLDIINIAEHELFRALAALMFLATKKKIEYADFLEVHRILFAGLYPWAGKDRSEILRDSAIKKGAATTRHLTSTGCVAKQSRTFVIFSVT